MSKGQEWSVSDHSWSEAMGRVWEHLNKFQYDHLIRLQKSMGTPQAASLSAVKEFVKGMRKHLMGVEDLIERERELLEKRGGSMRGEKSSGQSAERYQGLTEAREVLETHWGWVVNCVLPGMRGAMGEMIARQEREFKQLLEKALGKVEYEMVEIEDRPLREFANLKVEEVAVPVAPEFEGVRIDTSLPKIVKCAACGKENDEGIHELSRMVPVRSKWLSLIDHGEVLSWYCGRECFDALYAWGAAASKKGEME